MCPAVPSAPLAVPPRPSPDVVVGPPTYQSGLPALRPTPPRATWAGRWLAVGMVVLIALGIAAYVWRDGIRGTLPADWQTALNLDAVRGLLKK